jgi:hypothetical protein
VQAIIDAPEDILISRHLIAIGIFMVRANIVPDVKSRGLGYTTAAEAHFVTAFPMTVLAALHIQLLAGLNVGGCGRRTSLRECRGTEPGPPDDAGTEH